MEKKITRKKGRPKSIHNRNARRHAIQLNEKAETLLREVRKKREMFDFSRYVSECIVRDFGSDSGMIKYLKQKIAQNTQEKETLDAERDEIISQIRTIQEKEMQEIDKNVMTNE